jgi:hypothetical protein
MEDISIKQRKAPLILKLMEGATTTMLIGFWCAGGRVYSPLSFVYALHWMASFNEHLFPSCQNFAIDVLFIDMIGMERLFYICHSYLVYLIFLLLIDTNQHHLMVSFFKVLSSFIYLKVIMGVGSYEYDMMFFLGGLFFLLSCMSIRHERFVIKTFFHVCFHLSMAYASFLEVDYYISPHDEKFDVVRAIVYGSYILKFARIKYIV